LDYNGKRIGVSVVPSSADTPTPLQGFAYPKANTTAMLLRLIRYFRPVSAQGESRRPWFDA
jgi:hypothetical protein